MESIVLDGLKFDPDPSMLLERLRIPSGGRQEEELRRFLEEAREIARPKALLRVAFIQAKGGGWVQIEGIEFRSRVLRINLEDVNRVFAYVATCGVEMEGWAQSHIDLLERYWADVIMEAALRSASQAVEEEIEARYHPGQTSRMHPGSLEDWPLEEQVKLFRLLGDPESAIGVHLTVGNLMRPIKSVSGMMFASEVRFESCQLCPREGCPERRAPYDAELYGRKYRPS